MNHLIKFEKFNVNEWFGQKFFTGHSKGEKEIAKQRIENEIEKFFSEIKSKVEKDPDILKKFPQLNNIQLSKEKLIKIAKDNNYIGNIIFQKSPTGEVYVVYKNGKTGFQDIASGVSSGMK